MTVMVGLRHPIFYSFKKFTFSITIHCEIQYIFLTCLPNYCVFCFLINHPIYIINIFHTSLSNIQDVLWM